MFAQAIGAKMKLMHSALNHGNIAVTQIASIFCFFDRNRFRTGRNSCVQHASLEIKSARGQQRSQRKGGRAKGKQISVGMIHRCRRENTHSRENTYHAAANNPVSYR